MTIIEAIKSGKNFKRRHHGNTLWISKECLSLTIDKAALIADDWEVEEKKVEITHRDLLCAWGRALKARVNANMIVYFDDLAKELGLE